MVDVNFFVLLTSAVLRNPTPLNVIQTGELLYHTKGGTCVPCNTWTQRVNFKDTLKVTEKVPKTHARYIEESRNNLGRAIQQVVYRSEALFRHTLVTILGSGHNQVLKLLYVCSYVFS